MKKHSTKEYVGKIRLYADENIRYGIVLVLRAQGINIEHAKEKNLLGKNDQEHFQYARKTNRWLLTTDKHYLNNKKYPFDLVRGIAIVPDTGKDIIAGMILVWLKNELVPSGKGIDHCKVEFKSGKAIFHFKSEGRIHCQYIELT